MQLADSGSSALKEKSKIEKRRRVTSIKMMVSTCSAKSKENSLFGIRQFCTQSERQGAREGEVKIWPKINNGEEKRCVSLEITILQIPARTEPSWCEQRKVNGTLHRHREQCMKNYTNV